MSRSLWDVGLIEESKLKTFHKKKNNQRARTPFAKEHKDWPKKTGKKLLFSDEYLNVLGVIAGTMHRDLKTKGMIRDTLFLKRSMVECTFFYGKMSSLKRCRFVSSNPLPPWQLEECLGIFLPTSK